MTDLHVDDNMRLPRAQHVFAYQFARSMQSAFDGTGPLSQAGRDFGNGQFFKIAQEYGLKVMRR